MLDCSFVCPLFVNHATLIRNVYPTSPGEEGPRASNLSLLVTYSQNRPNKLLKIGRYLEKRLRRDLKKSRTGYIKVSFDILNSLLEACHAHLNLFAINVLAMISDVLGSANTELNIMASTTFVLFSSFYVHNGMEKLKDFAQIYQQVVKKFCTLASYSTKDSMVQMRLRLSGLKSIESIVSSPSFFMASHAEIIIEQITPYLLSNIIDQPSTHTSLGRLVTAGGLKNRERISIQDELISDGELEHIAESCIKEISANLNASNLRWLLDSVYADLKSTNKFQEPSLCLHVFAIIHRFLSNQYQAFLLSSVLSQLTSTKDEHVKKSLILVINHFLENSDPTVSIIELLDTVCKCLDSQAQVEKCILSLAQQPVEDRFQKIVDYMLERIKLDAEEKRRKVLVEILERVCETGQGTINEKSVRDTALILLAVPAGDIDLKSGLFRIVARLLPKLTDGGSLDWIRELNACVAKSFHLLHGDVLISSFLALVQASRWKRALVQDVIPLLKYIAETLPMNTSTLSWICILIETFGDAVGRRSDATDALAKVKSGCTWGVWDFESSRLSLPLNLSKTNMTIDWRKIYEIFGVESTSIFTQDMLLNPSSMERVEGILPRKKSKTNMSVSISASSRKIGNARTGTGWSENGTNVTVGNLREALFGTGLSTVDAGATIPLSNRGGSDGGAGTLEMTELKIQDIKIVVNIAGAST